MSGTEAAHRRSAPRRSPWRRFAPAALALLLSLAWFVVVEVLLERQARAREHEALDVTAKTYAALAERTRGHLRNECQYLAEDPRLKAMIFSELESQTLAEFTTTLSRVLSKALVVVLSPDGVVIASSDGSLDGADLSKSAVIARSLTQKSAATGRWSFEDRLLHVAARSIRLGDRQLAILAVATPVDQATMETVEDVSAVDAAVMVGDNVVASSKPANDFDRYADLAPGSAIRLDEVVVRVQALESTALPTRMIFEAPRHRFQLRPLLWIPMAGAIFLGLRESRRMDREEG